MGLNPIGYRFKRRAIYDDFSVIDRFNFGGIFFRGKRPAPSRAFYLYRFPVYRGQINIRGDFFCSIDTDSFERLMIYFLPQVIVKAYAGRNFRSLAGAAIVNDMQCDSAFPAPFILFEIDGLLSFWFMPESRPVLPGMVAADNIKLKAN